MTQKQKIMNSLITIVTGPLLAVTFLSAPSAMAADNTVSPAAPQNFTVRSASDGKIRLSVKSFKKGDMERSIRFSQSALRANLSKAKQAVAHSNLCAAYGELGDLEKASTACDIALEIRPDMEEARNNKNALSVRLAQK